MNAPLTRRHFLASAAAAGAGVLSAGMLSGCAMLNGKPKQNPYDISLAQWSLHRTLFSKKLDHLDFAATTRNVYGLGAVEYVNQFFKDKAKDSAYLAQMNQRAADHDVRNVLIMCDGEGRLGDADAAKRTQAVENHYKWVDAARTLGCHAIRVNAASEGSYDEQIRLAADGLHRLSEYGGRQGISVIVENHGGLSSNGAWLAAVIKAADHPRCGTLPDFGNFTIRPGETYDRYQGVAELMPFAKGVSAKTHDFDASGAETGIDYPRIMRIVLEAGYHGYVGIEYEGAKMSEHEGIVATRDLLLRLREELAA